MSVIADPGLAHQIVIRIGQPEAGLGGRLVVSCNCLWRPAGRGQNTHRPIEARPRWETGEALEAYRNWHIDQGIDLDGQQAD